MLNEGKRFASPGSCSDKDWTICSFNSLSLAVICVFKIKHESYTPRFSNQLLLASSDIH